jgi:hypothetical protein
VLAEEVLDFMIPQWAGCLGETGNLSTPQRLAGFIARAQRNPAVRVRMGRERYPQMKRKSAGGKYSREREILFKIRAKKDKFEINIASHNGYYVNLIYGEGQMPPTMLFSLILSVFFEAPVRSSYVARFCPPI